MSDDEKYAPSVFMADYDLPDLNTITNEPLPRGVEGGVVETVKRAIVTAVREALTDTGMVVINTTDSAKPEGNAVCVDLEYPMKEVHYPGIWVQFSITSLKRAGIDMESLVFEDGQWCPIQEWEIQGRVTLTIVALTNKDRDRLADKIISMLAFARPPERVLTDPARDAKQNRALRAALANNPHIAATINTDVLYPIGQTVNVGVPWKEGAILAYEDGYAFDLLGHFNVKFRHDGVYTLSRIDIEAEKVDELPQHHVTSPWYGVLPGRTL